MVYQSKKLGVAVDAADNAYVLDMRPKVVDEYSSSGVFVRQLAVGEVPAGAPEPGPLLDPVALAVDPANGDVYILDQSSQFSGGLNEAIDEFDSSGVFIRQITGQNIPANARWRADSRTRVVWRSTRAAMSTSTMNAARWTSSTPRVGSSRRLTGNDVPESAPVTGRWSEPFVGWGSVRAAICM